MSSDFMNDLKLKENLEPSTVLRISILYSWLLYTDFTKKYKKKSDEQKIHSSICDALT